MSPETVPLSYSPLDYLLQLPKQTLDRLYHTQEQGVLHTHPATCLAIFR